MKDEKNFLEQINEDKESKVLESFQVEKYETTVKRPSFIPLVSVLLIISVLSAAYLLLFDRSAVVVDFTGMAVEQVEAWAVANDVMLLKQEKFDDRLSGTVISQNFEAGYNMRRQDTMVVTLSQGPDPYERVSFPDFDSQWSRISVQQWLEQEQIQNFAFRFINDEAVEADYLVNYVLVGAKEDSFLRSSSVEFIFSQPVSTSTVVIPNFLGTSLAEFDIWAVGQGFTYEHSEAYSDIYSHGQIMDQSFVPDMALQTSDILHVTVSMGASDEMVEMISLLNMDVTEAQSWLAENGLSVSKFRRFDSDFRRGSVISQDIEAGMEIAKGSTVSLEISVGEASTVPDFSMYKYPEYTAAEGSYDGLVHVRNVFDDEVPAGQLISQSPAAGVFTDGSEPVEVVYSLGGSVLVPDFRQQTILEMTRWVDEQNARGASIELKVTEDQTLNEDYGVIFTQNIYNGPIGIGGEVQVTIAVQKTVPDFSAMTRAEVQSYSERCGYPVIINERYKYDTYVGDFIWQSVKAGTPVDPGISVSIDYSLGMTVHLGDYRDGPLSELENFIYDQRTNGLEIRLLVHEVYQDEIPYGTILSQDRFNDRVGGGTSITVIVSKGESFVMPDWTRSNRSSVESYADGQGLTVVFIEASSNEPSGAVIEQSVEAGTTISKNEFIYITIAE